MDANAFPRRILLAVTGLSPQVVTETLFALAVQKRPAFIPTQIHLVTTAEGAARVLSNLLDPESGWFHRLCREYRLAGIHFDRDTIHVLPDGLGRALADIRTPEDNERAADFITERVRALTADPQAALHVSIAGGRKTMGFYAGYALSLFGRPQDRLSHVLVSEGFESRWDFFYPRPQAPAGQQGEITLAEIPFVSLRHGLPKPLQEGKVTYSQTVAALNRSLGPPGLVLDLPGRRLQAGEVRFTLPPAELAFYAWLARRRLQGEGPLAGPGVNELRRDYAAAYMDEYRRIDPLGDEGRVAERLRYGMDKGDFDERKAKLHRSLRRALGPEAALYLIQGEGARPKRYRLGMAPEAIRFAALPEAADRGSP